jgi:hypothetical protein
MYHCGLVFGIGFLLTLNILSIRQIYPITNILVQEVFDTLMGSNPKACKLVFKFELPMSFFTTN